MGPELLELGMLGEGALAPLSRHELPRGQIHEPTSKIRKEEMKIKDRKRVREAELANKVVSKALEGVNQELNNVGAL